MDVAGAASSSTTMALYDVVKYVEGEATYTFVPICGGDDDDDEEKRSARKRRRRRSSSNRAAGCKKKSTLKFVCPTCEFSTNERQLMIEHFTAKHCMKVSDLQQPQPFVENEDVVVEELELTELTCAQCGFSSYDQDDLDFHACNKPQQQYFSCHLCTYECLTRTGLQSHVTRKHKVNKPAASTYYACNECDYKCANKSTLYSHKRKHRKSQHHKPKHRKAASTAKQQQQQQQQQQFFCNECDYSSAKKSALSQHIKNLHCEPLTLTLIGGGGGAAAASGRRSKDQQLFSCEQCPYTNKNRYEMKVHVIRKHSNEYNYECEQCGKKYKIKGDLTNHIRFQHREQPIICDVCGKTCGNSNSLYVHQKFAHYKAEFECQICKRRMVSQANLDEHVLKQHEQREDAICEECGKTFTRQSRLKIHMRIHLGIKPHTCKLCGKAFSRKTALRQHLLIHSGQRPYLCDICGKSFTQKPGLISHRKSHPGSHPPLPRVTIDHVLSDLLTAQQQQEDT